MYHHIPKVFLSEIFGELRIIEDNNKFYFCANDICSALGYANVSRELNLHCRQDGITSSHVDCNGVPRIMKFISEGNVYRLICSSHKPDAEMFEKWVFDELLPTIRATGGYVNDPVVFVNEWLPNTDEKTKELLVTSLEAVKRQDKIIGVQKESIGYDDAWWPIYGYRLIDPSEYCWSVIYEFGLLFDYKENRCKDCREGA